MNIHQHHNQQALNVRNISLSYGNFKALHDISFQIDAEEVVAILGPNGAGKSSLVKAICGRADIREGSIKINQQDKDSPAARRQLGVAPQCPALYDLLTARENLICFSRQVGMKKSQAVTRADEILDIIDMRGHAYIQVSRLSGGMRQRINIGAAICHKPSLIILDEPAASLDPLSVTAINTLIKRLKGDGFAVLLITHDMAQATNLADRVIILAEGEIKSAGTPAEVIQKICGTYAKLSVSSTSDHELQTLGFSRSLTDANRWQQQFNNHADAIAMLSTLHAKAIAMDESTITLANLDDVLHIVGQKG